MTCHSGCKAVYEREVSNMCPHSGAMIKYNCECPGFPSTKTAVIIISIVVCCCIFLVLIWEVLFNKLIRLVDQLFFGVQTERAAAEAVHPEQAVEATVIGKAQEEVQPAAATDAEAIQRQRAMNVPDGLTAGQQSQAQGPNRMSTVSVLDTVLPGQPMQGQVPSQGLPAFSICVVGRPVMPVRNFGQ